jgi:formylglycine-generating enzyme required for sulfatase activity
MMTSLPPTDRPTRGGVLAKCFTAAGVVLLLTAAPTPAGSAEVDPDAEAMTSPSCCDLPAGREGRVLAHLASAAAEPAPGPFLGKAPDEAATTAPGSNPGAAPDEAPGIAPGFAPGPAPEGMVWVPPGTFVMGTDAPDTWANEHPSHPVTLDGFWMDRTEVTNAQFAAFIEATGYQTVAERPVDWEAMKSQVPPGTPKPPDDVLQPGSLVFTPPDHPVPLNHVAAWWTWTNHADWRHPTGPGSSIEGKDDHPVVHIAWEDAAAYAAWAGKQLPTEAQWEYAARGGSDNTRFAWGDTFKPDGQSMANTWDGQFPHRNTEADGHARAAPVGTYPANGFGLYDMAGNVWEWTADFYRDDRNAILAQRARRGPVVNPPGPDMPSDAANPHSRSRVIKGGSFLCHVDYCESYRPAARRGTPEDTGLQHTGFRCIKMPEP